MAAYKSAHLHQPGCANAALLECLNATNFAGSTMQVGLEASKCGVVKIAAQDTMVHYSKKKLKTVLAPH